MVFSIVVFLAKMSLSGLGMCCLNRGYITWPRGDTKVLFKCCKIAAYFPISCFALRVAIVVLNTASVKIVKPYVVLFIQISLDA